MKPFRMGRKLNRNRGVTQLVDVEAVRDRHHYGVPWKRRWIGVRGRRAMRRMDRHFRQKAARENRRRARELNALTAYVEKHGL
jgi:hypothetical protein